MMKHNTKYILLASVLSLVAATACQRDELTDRTPAGEGILNFSMGFAGSGEIALSKGATLTSADGTVSIPLTCSVTDGIEVNLPDAEGIESASVTKGTQINSEAEFLDEGLTSFTVAGWNADKSTFVPSGTAVKYSDGRWKTDATYRWRGSDRKTFLTYANLPELIASVVNTVTASPDVVKQTFSYTVPTDAREQNDIMLGWYEGDGDGTATAAITMVHPLTAVVFKKGEIDEDVIAIKSISISGVYTSGVADVTYALSGSDVVPTYDWGSSRAGSQTVTLEPAEGKTELEVAADGKIGTSFIILPQEVADNSLTLKITVVRNGSDVELVSYLPAGEWEEGKTNTFTIGYAGRFVITCDESFTTDFKGDGREFSVESYYTSDNGVTKKPVNVNILYSTDGGETWTAASPEWLHSTIAHTPDASDPTFSGAFTADVLPRTPDANTAQIITNLVNKKTDPSWTSSADNRIDLSRGKETANTYIVNAPGYFKIPLVYGNARGADGNANTGSYAPSGRDHLWNYLGNEIGSMYIYNDESGCCHDATLVWQDEPNLVKNVKLSSNGQFIEFDIPEESVMQGNALIAVRDGDGRIVWSWLIWVTDYVSGTNNRTIGHEGHSLTLMDEFIGWCKAESISYGSSDRTCMIKFEQIGNGSKSFTSSYTQKTGVVTYNGNAPFYQHGRFAPEPASAGKSDNSGKIIYYGNPDYTYYGYLDQTTVAGAIQHPYVHYSHHGDNPQSGEDHNWCRTKWQNLWHQQKTVYDPSPAGYRIANGGEYFWIVNVSAQASGDGMYLQDTGGSYTVHFPYAGQRAWHTGDLMNVTTDVALWGYGLYTDDPYSKPGVLGFSLYKSEEGGNPCMKQGWTDTAASYILKPTPDN